MPRALEGVRVLETGTLVAGPVVGTLLGDMGAEIVKVEEAAFGDTIRRSYPPLIDDISGYFLIMARNKKSCTLNLRMPKGQEIFKELVKVCDIVTENFTPGTMDDWGLGYEELRKVNPGIIMLSNSIYGGTGPYSKRPGLDWIAQAHSGIMSVTGDIDGPATMAGPAVSDYIGGLMAVYGVLSALHYKNRTGLGQWVDNSMFESSAFTMAWRVPHFTRLGIVAGRKGARGAGPLTRSFPTKDGDVFVVATPARRKELLEAMGREDLLADPRFQGDRYTVLGPEATAELERLVEEWCASKTREEIVEVLLARDVPGAPVKNVAELMSDYQFIARGALVEIDHPGVGRVQFQGPVPQLSLTPARVESPAPSLGQHNDYVYREILRLTQEQVDQMRADGVI
ncbi:MAG: CoA transferase [Dehalococcoidia bacterium]|nr:CoA transferase [Dehalococcoidia bacterium]